MEWVDPDDLQDGACAPLPGLLWRSLISGFVLLLFALTCLPAIRWPQIRAQAVFGVLAIAFYTSLFTKGIEMGPPTGLVALMSDMLPLASPSWAGCWTGIDQDAMGS